MSLRGVSRRDAKQLNQQDWGGLIVLIGPDGTRYDTDIETGQPLKTLMTRNDKYRVIPDTGEDMLTSVPFVVLSLDSIPVAPKAGERWGMEIQFKEGGPLVYHDISDERSPEGGGSLGVIRLYPHEVTQL